MISPTWRTDCLCSPLGGSFLPLGRGASEAAYLATSHTAVAKRLRRADQQRLAGDLIATSEEYQIVPACLLDAHQQVVKRQLLRLERIGVIERIGGRPLPDGIAVCGSQLEPRGVGAVPARDVRVDRQPNVGREHRDGNVTHRSCDDEFVCPRVVPDLAADDERLHLRWR